jgi:hypothetical protein
LEALRILEAEVDLREQTRVAEQARPALEEKKHRAAARKLGQVQDQLRERVKQVIGRIRELPSGREQFAKEILLLGQVAVVMGEANGILNRFETGWKAMAAETEVIELLLQSRRINPKGGGGGGSSPGGGGGGTTQDAALAILGTGVNEKEVREDRGVAQTVGNTQSTYPEEFRAGLDEYFQRLERSGQ